MSKNTFTKLYGRKPKYKTGDKVCTLITPKIENGTLLIDAKYLPPHTLRLGDFPRLLMAEEILIDETGILLKCRIIRANARKQNAE